MCGVEEGLEKLTIMQLGGDSCWTVDAVVMVVRPQMSPPFDGCSS